MFLGQADKRINNNRKKRFCDYFTGPQNKFGADSRSEETRSQIQSGTLNFTKSKIRGFTLIELLVVISIIALLSTIILGAISDAREKAQVKKKNEIARQYINALELYASDNSGEYPATGVALECLGYATSETCFGSTDGNTTLNGLIDQYYSGMPKNDDFIVQFSTIESTGVMYRCDTTSNCFIQWYLPSDQSCISGVTQATVLSTSRCTYRLKCANGSGVNCN